MKKNNGALNEISGGHLNIKMWRRKYKNAPKALEEANNPLWEGNDAEMFVTVWLGILDIHTGLIENLINERNAHKSRGKTDWGTRNFHG